MPKMTGGQAVVESLVTQGVELVFGVISIHNIHLHDALYGARDKIRYVGGRMEMGCGFMADGYARASGRPGVIVTSSGPGAAHTMGALGEAYFAGSPVLEITTNVEKELVGRMKGANHEVKDQLGMFRAVTDWNALITNVEAIPDHIYEAFRRFKTRRPTPIELEIPNDLLSQQGDVEIGPLGDVLPTQGDPALVEKAVQLLLKAKRPFIWVGEEAQACEATEELIKLADRLGAPVVSAHGGKGAFPEDHPLALGNKMRSKSPTPEFIGNCDLALVVGSGLAYNTSLGYGLKLPQNLIHIMLDGAFIGKNYPATVGIVGDSKAVLHQMLASIGDRDVYKGDAFAKEVEEVKNRTDQALRELWPVQISMMEAIRSVLPRDTIASWDPTMSVAHATRSFPAYAPHTFMVANGWGGIGFGFPASLGAKLAKPTSPVVCFTGDGGFQYNMQELGTAVQHGINPVVVIFNDNAWGILKQFQRERFQERYLGVDLVNPDFVKLFDSYGVEGTRVETVKGLLKALDSAVGANTMRLIEVDIPNGFPNFK